MPSQKLDFQAIGTDWIIDLPDNLEPKQVKKIEALIQDKIAAFDKIFSRFRADSLIYSLADKPGQIEIPIESWPMIELYQQLYEISDGLVTPLIGSLLEQTGYDMNYSLVESKLTKPLTWEEAIVLDRPKLELKKSAVLDFGALGKGHLIDLIAGLLIGQGLDNFCIDAGGDILQRSKSPDKLKIGLEHPDNFEQVIGVTEIINKSLCASAGNRRKWGRFHHIINPQTLESVNTIKAVWVVADSTMLADAMSTALFFVDADQLQTKFDFEYLILYPDYSIKKSTNFLAELYYN